MTTLNLKSYYNHWGDLCVSKQRHPIKYRCKSGVNSHTRYFFVVTTSIVLLCHSFSIILAAQPLYPVEKGRGGRNGRSLKKAGGVVGENCDHFHPNNTSEQSTPNRHHCLPIKSNKKSKQHEETKTKKSKVNVRFFQIY